MEEREQRLFDAVERGAEADVKALIKDGVEVNARSDERRNALMICVCQKKAEQTPLARQLELFAS